MFERMSYNISVVDVDNLASFGIFILIKILEIPTRVLISMIYLFNRDFRIGLVKTATEGLYYDRVLKDYGDIYNGDGKEHYIDSVKNSVMFPVWFEIKRRASKKVDEKIQKEGPF